MVPKLSPWDFWCSAVVDCHTRCSSFSSPLSQRAGSMATIVVFGEGMDVVKAVEAEGSPSGKTKSKVTTTSSGTV
ncbi:hypothetical protein K435DRAFT_871041 [Dendrothele bispora CBS 962.96]|uniref:Uncharacterized protein n=1 Tax=Dendrothele bispora (strain CBS 962.96) TaxID=1314807 RepID=A0A4S8L556_DENBC|nr:hypothetical protein K435DRAFT_871041 [Dendrothele bispora CBS 962.96]